MDSIKSAKPGSSAQESAITLLRDAAIALRAHPRDPNAAVVVGRITRLLASFPTHFVTEFLQRDEVGRVTLHRVALSDWPDWSQQLGRDLGVVDGGEVAAGKLEAYAFDGAPLSSLGESAERAALEELLGWVERAVVPEFSDRKPMPENCRKALASARVALGRAPE